MKIFLSSIQENDSNEFEINFISKPSNKKKSNFWKFTSSRNNNKILKNVLKNDWFLFAYNGKYMYAAQVKERQKLVVSFKNLTEISRDFVKTNNELGISSSMPSVHRIPLLEVNYSKTQQIIKKYHSIEGFLHERKIQIKKPPKKIIKEITIEPASVKKIPRKIKTTTVRVIRDTVKTKKLKIRYDNICQVCRSKIAENYSDVHHVWPIGDKGDDDYDNMLVLCPNHHAMFDLALIQFDESRKGHLVHVNGKEYGKLYFKKDHRIHQKNIEHNNMRVKKVHGT